MRIEHLRGFCSGSVLFIEKEEDLKVIALGSRNCLVFYKGSNPSWNETLSQIFPEPKEVNGNTYFFSNEVALKSLKAVSIERGRFMGSSVEDCTHYSPNPYVINHYCNDNRASKKSKYSSEGYPKSFLSDQEKKYLTPMKLCTLIVGDIVKIKSEFEGHIGRYGLTLGERYKIDHLGYSGGYCLSCKNSNNGSFSLPYTVLEKV